MHAERTPPPSPPGSGPDRDPHDEELADRLGLEPPQTIHRVGEALETLMEDDVAAGRPMLAALCVSKTQPGIPARGFFLAAQVLGYFCGDPTGPEARAFHAIELQRVLAFYGR